MLPKMLIKQKPPKIPQTGSLVALFLILYNEYNNPDYSNRKNN